MEYFMKRLHKTVNECKTFEILKLIYLFTLPFILSCSSQVTNDKNLINTTGAMLPNIGIGETVKVKLQFEQLDIKRGTIVAYKAINQTSNQEYNDLKRVIGIPGDQVSVLGLEVFINGKQLRQIKKDISPSLKVGNFPQYDFDVFEEENESSKYLVAYERDSFALIDSKKVEVLLGVDEYFVLGDNRCFSCD